MPEDENLHGLEDLQHKLYAKDADLPRMETPMPVAAPPPPPVERHWEPEPTPEKKRISPSAYFLIGAIAFFAIASIIAVLFLFFGTRSVSTDRVDVAIKGPTSIASGDAVQLVITIDNRNPAPIESTLLTVEYPEGTRSADNTSEEMVRYTDTVGSVMPGERATRTARAVISGAANQVVTIPVTFEYRIEGSNAVFVKREEYSFTITSSPVSLSVAALSESASGQPVTVTVIARANGTDPVESVAVMGEYPFGFQVQSTEPAAAQGNLFELGGLAPGESKTIRVTGILTGQQGDERVFRFTAGTPRGGGSQALAVTYTTQEALVTITRPFLGVALSLNRDESDTVIVRAGEQVQGTLSWANSLPTTVLDGQINVRVSGDAADTRNVKASSGFYRSSDQTIVFNRETSAGLRELQPGDSGGGSFTVPMRSKAELAALRNPTMTFTVSVAGRRVGESGVPETINSTVTKTVKVSTDLTLTSRAVRSTGPFTNTGPWPPVADQETTYTILLSASNTVNSVGGAKVTATLPSYVTFTGMVQPADGSVTYNASTREVSWVVGDMPAGTSGRTAAFQVSLLPSTSQRGTSPVLVFPQTISGYDRFVEKQVTSTASDLTTETTSDPGYNNSLGTVTR
ncbi:MAG TPA: hypothetical protein VEA92_00130 [Candidatus Paceibacterota bacterium]|nr:hypothetical protein [Candidatus Paceibacterota bacterium]